MSLCPKVRNTEHSRRPYPIVEVDGAWEEGVDKHRRMNDVRGLWLVEVLMRRAQSGKWRGVRDGYCFSSSIVERIIFTGIY